MKYPTDVQPPKWPLRLMRFFVKKEYLEEIEGDMEEVFRDNAEHFSTKRARRMYTWEMLKLLRPTLVKHLEIFNYLHQPAMFRNYFKVSLRGLMKQPLNSFINIFGLAVAIGISILAYAFAQWTYNTDQFHEHKHQVHLVTFFANRDGSLQQYGQTPRPLGEFLREDFASIRKVCRVEDRPVVVKYGDNVFHEKVRYTDPEFLEMFTFPMKWGSPASLRDIHGVIISEDMSFKYFGEDNPVGRDLLIKFSETNSKVFKIAGVAERFPDGRTIEFDFLINFENFRTSDPSYNFRDWSAFVNATFIQVTEQSDLSSIRRGMEKYLALQNEVVEEDWAIESFGFEPLATLHRQSSNIKDDISMSSDAKYQSIIFLAIIATIMLALACFNYINIAIVTAARRLKEIGIRKTIGASRKVVIVQFLSENIIVTFFALVVGFALGTLVFVPWLENLNHFSLEFDVLDKDLWIYLPAVLFVTGIASGIYPAFYISRFEVIHILKGSVQFGKKNPLTKIFLGVQLVLACILITTGVMFTKNTLHMAERSWGYNRHETLYAAVPDYAAFEKLSAELSQNPNIISISGAQHHLGKSHTNTVVHFPDRQFEVSQMSVQPNYFETMGLELTSGRAFRDNHESEKRTAIVNEAFVASLGLVNPIGEVFKIDSIQHEIIGVTKDFHSYSFFRKVTPTIFKVAEKEAYRYLAIKVEQGSEHETVKALQAHWIKLYPETPFDGGFQEDVWGTYFEQIAIHARVWKGFAIIAILLAALGLYGLVTLNVAGRVKEFSIRKILGAGLRSISRSISGQFAVLLSVALALGAPVSYFLNKMLFDIIYHYHMPITYAGVLIAIGILTLVLLATVSTQIRKVMKANPVNGLKSE